VQIAKSGELSCNHAHMYKMKIELMRCLGISIRISSSKHFTSTAVHWWL